MHHKCDLVLLIWLCLCDMSGVEQVLRKLKVVQYFICLWTDDIQSSSDRADASMLLQFFCMRFEEALCLLCMSACGCDIFLFNI